MNDKEYISLMKDFEREKQVWFEQKMSYIKQIDQLKKDTAGYHKLMIEARMRENELFRDNVELKSRVCV